MHQVREAPPPFSMVYRVWMRHAAAQQWATAVSAWVQRTKGSSWVSGWPRPCGVNERGPVSRAVAGWSALRIEGSVAVGGGAENFNASAGVCPSTKAADRRFCRSSRLKP